LLEVRILIHLIVLLLTIVIATPMFCPVYAKENISKLPVYIPMALENAALVCNKVFISIYDFPFHQTDKGQGKFFNRFV
jgi:hypothetical protein